MALLPENANIDYDVFAMRAIIRNAESSPSNLVLLFDIINAVEDCTWLHRLNVRYRLFDNVRRIQALFDKQSL